MSQENVDVVGRTYEAFDRREMYLDVWHPEAEFRPAMAGAVEGKVYRGHSEMRHYLNELFESFSEVLVEDREFRDLGDRVLVLYRLRVQGRDSDLEIDQPGAALYELRDGKILWAASYLSQADALKAAGVFGVGAIPSRAKPGSGHAPNARGQRRAHWAPVRFQHPDQAPAV